MIVTQTERNEDVDPWEVVEFPAIKDDGTALWPEFWDVERALVKKSGLGHPLLERAVHAAAHF
jgi:hypothetical protein